MCRSSVQRRRLVYLQLMNSALNMRASILLKTRLSQRGNVGPLYLTCENLQHRPCLS